jgi:hypothetical protein
MTETNQRYIEAQLFGVAPLPVYEMKTLRIKLRTEKGETNWLSVSATAYREIESKLILDALAKDGEAKHDRD